MANPITIFNDDYVLDKSSGVYVARNHLMRDERVLSAAKKVIDSGRYDSSGYEVWFAKLLQDEKYPRADNRVDVKTLRGINALFKELELPQNLRANQRLCSRIMTREEYIKYAEWATSENDPVLYESINEALSEVVYDPTSKRFQLAISLYEEPGFRNPPEEILDGRSIGICYGVREVIDKKPSLKTLIVQFFLKTSRFQI